MSTVHGVVKFLHTLDVPDTVGFTPLVGGSRLGLFSLRLTQAISQ